MNLGPMVAALVVTVVAAIVMLQNVLQNQDALNRQSWIIENDVKGISNSVYSIELNLRDVGADRPENSELAKQVLADVAQMQSAVKDMADFQLCDKDNCKAMYVRIVTRMPDFQNVVQALLDSRDAAGAPTLRENAARIARAMQQDTLPLSQCVHDRAHEAQAALSAKFRWIVLAIGMIFVVVINLAVITLLRLGRVILKPIDTLVAATQQLQNGRLGYRASMDEHNEFDQLAKVYNTLAEQLEGNEKRKLEMLAQVAAAMNHELNNVISIITLQLRIAGKQAPQNPQLEACLKQIQGSLGRMTDTVSALKNVRRIVLTEYISGTKMLDLKRSVEENDSVVTETANV